MQPWRACRAGCGWLQAEKAAQAAELDALLNQHTQQQLQLKDAFAKSDQVNSSNIGLCLR